MVMLGAVTSPSQYELLMACPSLPGDDEGSGQRRLLVRVWNLQTLRESLHCQAHAEPSIQTTRAAKTMALMSDYVPLSGKPPTKVHSVSGVQQGWRLSSLCVPHFRGI